MAHNRRPRVGCACGGNRGLAASVTMPKRPTAEPSCDGPAAESAMRMERHGELLRVLQTDVNGKVLATCQAWVRIALTLLG